MYRVLIADDDEDVRRVIKEYVLRDGGEAVCAADGFEAVCAARRQDFDVIVMDVQMPRMDGFSACLEIAGFKSAPVLLLSDNGDESCRLRGFEIGADDFMVKPFSPKELIARLNVIVRRAARGCASAPHSAGSTEERLRFGGLEVDIPGHGVLVDGVKSDLTQKQFELLLCLIRNRNIVLTRDRLLDEVWGFDFAGDDRTVDSHIRMLRGSLGAYRGYIKTLRGAGYKFAPE